MSGSVGSKVPDWVGREIVGELYAFSCRVVPSLEWVQVRGLSALGVGAEWQDLLKMYPAGSLVTFIPAEVWTNSDGSIYLTIKEIKSVRPRVDPIVWTGTMMSNAFERNDGAFFRIGNPSLEAKTKVSDEMWNRIVDDARQKGLPTMVDIHVSDIRTTMTHVDVLVDAVFPHKSNSQPPQPPVNTQTTETTAAIMTNPPQSQSQTERPVADPKRDKHPVKPT